MGNQRDLLLIDIGMNDPQFNLQTDQDIFDYYHNNDHILMFYTNNPCLVVGRYQEVPFEVNSQYIKITHLPVFRRFSGGGTVYHDQGTLNVSFLTKRRNNNIMNCRFEISHILKNAIDENNEYELRIDDNGAIFRKENKILGSAMRLGAIKLFYHASILVNTDLKALNSAILKDEIYPINRNNYVRSIRSKVENISNFSSLGMGNIKKSIIKQFYDYLKPNLIKKITSNNELKEILYV